MPISSIERHITADDLTKALHTDVREGLTGTPKTLPPKWFYDARGSELFERITALEEYYPTRAERAILAAHAGDIAAASAADTLLELGSGSSEKSRLLLDAMAARGTLRRYVPVDVSDSALEEAAECIAADYPAIDVHGIVADFDRSLAALPDNPAGSVGTDPANNAAGNAAANPGSSPPHEPVSTRRMVALLGGTIGNFFPDERVSFLDRLRAGLAAGDTLLLGTDLVKSPERLVAAYDDAAGVTAAFNRNVLHVINRELGADFTVDTFAHVARWDERHERVEMRLRSREAQRVRVRALDLTVSFAEGEEIRTEISSKFRQTRVEQELAEAGFTLRHWWTDPAGDFALSLASPTAVERSAGEGYA